MNPFDFKFPQQNLLGGYYPPTPMQRQESPHGGTLSTLKKKRKVFFSFHYEADVLRAAQVRNMGVVEDNRRCSPNEWEKVWRAGDVAVKRWIDGQLAGRTCTVVLIGEDTFSRRWVHYEIIESWNRGMGVLGINIHNLNCPRSGVCAKGASPFESISLEHGHGTPLSRIVRVYDPIGLTSRHVHAQIRMGLDSWIETAISIRNRYPKS